MLSPLMRGAWIETPILVACHWNNVSRPSCEGRGLKRGRVAQPLRDPASPLMRGAWIETNDRAVFVGDVRSPLMRGAWIETSPAMTRSTTSRSPLMRGAWIETRVLRPCRRAGGVAPHARGVD